MSAPSRIFIAAGGILLVLSAMGWGSVLAETSGNWMAALKAVWRMPEGIGALIGAFFGAIVGFCALAWASIHAANAQLDRDRRLQEEDGKSLALSLAAEILALIKELHLRREVLQAMIYENRLYEPHDRVVENLTTPPPTKVYDANLHRLGLLGHSLAKNTVDGYALLATLYYSGPRKMVQDLPDHFLDNHIEIADTCNVLAAGLIAFGTRERPWIERRPE